jgi:hypothetical protein
VDVAKGVRKTVCPKRQRDSKTGRKDPMFFLVGSQRSEGPTVEDAVDHGRAHPK